MTIVNQNKQQNHVVITMDREELSEFKTDLICFARWYSATEQGSVPTSDRERLYRLLQLLEELEKEQ